MIEPETAPETPADTAESPPEPQPGSDPGSDPSLEPEPAEGEPAPQELEETTLDEAEAEANLLEGEIEATQRHLAGLLGIPLDGETVTCPTCRLGWLPHRLLQSDQHKRCAKCGGYGKVLTDALVEGEELATCGVCGGKGWDHVFAQPTAIAAPAPSEPPLTAAAFDYTQVQVPVVPPLTVGN